MSGQHMHIPDLLGMLHEMIARPSVSSTSPRFDMGNLAVIELLADWLDTLGFATDIIPLEDPRKANLIATLGSGPGGLVLAGHTDTVPFDERFWNHNPLALTEQDQRLYGLGATDMKGFFPIAIEAARDFLDTPLKQPLIILATADEESSMNGARKLAELGRPKARFAVIGEPTGLVPIRLHKGIMMEAVRVQGRSGHSSNPHLGVNALEIMHEVIGDLMSFRQAMQERHQHPMFDINRPTMNFGCIHGGDNPNRICGRCELNFDLRTLPGMNNQDLRDQINDRLQHIAARHGVPIELASLIQGVNSFEQQADSALIRAAETLTGHASESVAFATEAPFFKQLGMDCVVLGPGSIDQAHQPDEYMALDQLQPALKILKSLIKQFCL